jgi:transposase
MRGKKQEQPDFLTVVNLNQRVPPEHPLREIKRRADLVLAKLSPLFDQLYSEGGRPSIPPEQLLKARVLIALYSVRSERQFCEQLGYNLLWLWFLDRELDEGSWDATSFTQNQDRVLSSEVAQLFFAEIYQMSREEHWTSNSHFTVDGTLIDAWAGMKSFQRKDAPPRKSDDEDKGNPSVNFRGEKRSNQTHQSTTDPQAVLYRKGNGVESRLCFGAHVLMDNRHGLCAGIAVHNPIERREPAVALEQLKEQRAVWGDRVKTVGADKGYHEKAFVRGCREQSVSPHVACKRNLKVSGLDKRTIERNGYATSQKVRKRVEEIFGWMKTVGGLRKTRYRGIERTQSWAYMVAGAYNLLRMARLSAN